MDRGWYVSAKDISHWTETHKREAEETLPLLIQKLILASVQPLTIDFPSGDSVATGGYDGQVEVQQGNSFVPSGYSVWEFGTTDSINQKANEDYDKRTADPLGIDKKHTTFVFVTSRTWRDRDTWERGKGNKKEWLQVKALNATSIETWMHSCPGVHRWFASIIGKRPVGCVDLQQAWDTWRMATQPACSIDLIVAGRTEHKSEIWSKVQGPACVVRVWAESEEESYAFTLASLLEDQAVTSRFLAVKDQDAWDSLVASDSPLILMPMFPNTQGLGYAVQRGHSVIVPSSGKNTIPSDTEIVLGKASREHLIKALVQMGLSEAIAASVVTSSRGYIQPVRRHSALAPSDYSRPAWASQSYSVALISALLAGEWDSRNENDCSKLAEVSNMPYTDFEMKIHEISVMADPPVKQIGTLWNITSRQDVWRLVASFINQGALQRFFAIIKDVLHEADPRLELPPEQRWTANILGKETMHSSSLRHGLTESLTMLAAFGDLDLVGTALIQDQVSSVVRDVLITDMSGTRWGSLATYLPLLSEASPDVFIEAVEQGLQGSSPPVMDLFIEEGSMGGCPHSGLLWALECIAWRKDLFSRVCRALAKLHRLDPGGRYSNRPMYSLKQLLQGWLPQTNSTFTEKFETIDYVLKFEPDVGWELLLSLVPHPGMSATYIFKPRYRTWDEGWNGKAFLSDVEDYYNQIGNRIVDHADKELQRWIAVIPELPHLPKKSCALALSRLKLREREDFGNAADDMYHALRELIATHRKYADCEWAMDKAIVNEIATIYETLVPDDPILSCQYLFDKYYPKIVSDSYTDSDSETLSARLEALQKVWSSYGVAGIEQIAKTAREHGILGGCISQCTFDSAIQSVLLSWLDSNDQPLQYVAWAYVFSKSQGSQGWATQVWQQYHDTWPDTCWSSFCLGMPFCEASFVFMESLSSRIRSLYWSDVTWCALTDEDMPRAAWVVRKLLDINRPLKALAVAYNYLHRRNTVIDSDLLATILEQAATKPEARTGEVSPTLGYEISEIIKTIQDSHELSPQRVARIEWLYIDLSSFHDFRPTTLVKYITEDPAFFTTLISWAYKPNPPLAEDNDGISSDVALRRAEQAINLLDSVKTLPGQIDGDVNQDILMDWVTRVREGCRNINREAVGDITIGHVLSHSPVGKDTVWPHESVRHVLEVLESKYIESGIETCVLNGRGVTSRPVDQGGDQERQLAGHYESEANKLHRWPRTASLMKRIASHYIRDGLREDLYLQLREYDN